MTKLVSVITPHVGHPDKLRRRCIASVERQTYPEIEHIIVCDGPNPDLPEEHTERRRIVHLGRNWHGFTPQWSWGTMARLVASGLCRGDYIAYLDHDDEFLPNHVADLVALLEKTHSDFVFSKMEIHRFGSRSPYDRIIGQPPPRLRHISQDLVLHKAELWHVANADPYCRWNVAHLPKGEQHNAWYASDWDMIGRWVEAGAKWRFLDQITMIHHRDSVKELVDLTAKHTASIV